MQLVRGFVYHELFRIFLMTGLVSHLFCTGELSLYVSLAMPGVAYSSADEPMLCYTRLLLAQLKSRSAHQRATASAVIRNWAIEFTRKQTDQQGTLLTCCRNAQLISSGCQESVDVENCGDFSPSSANQNTFGAYAVIRATNGTYLNFTNGIQTKLSKYPSYLALSFPETKPENGENDVPGVAAMQELQNSLLDCMTQPVYYDEIAVSFTRLQQDTKDFLSMLRHYGVDVDVGLLLAPVLTLDQISMAVDGAWLIELLSGSKLRVKVRTTLEIRRQHMLAALQSTTVTQQSLTLSTRAEAAGALVRLGRLPQKLNPVVKPLMDSVKMEESEYLQRCVGEDLSVLLELCTTRDKSPNAKIVKNLASFFCVDPRHTPQLPSQPNSSQSIEHLCSGIYTLDPCVNLISSKPSCASGSDDAAAAASSVGSQKRKRGRPPSKAKEESDQRSVQKGSSTLNQKELSLIGTQRRGCWIALQDAAQHFGPHLPDQLPALWEMITKYLLSVDLTALSQTDKIEISDLVITETASTPCSDTSNIVNVASVSDLGPDCPIDITASQEVINWLQLLEAVLPVLHVSLQQQVCMHLPTLESYLYHRLSSVRHMTGRVLAVLATIDKISIQVMIYLITKLLPALSDIHIVTRRQGAVECLHLVVEKMGLHVLPYLVLLIVPLLSSSSDCDASVRSVGSQVFASLVRLMPLDGFMPDPPQLPHKIAILRDKHRNFLQQLMDGSKAHFYEVPIKIEATLREYQQAGVNWLAFLRDYGVHGILCDDMGLGKTLQTICILASTHHLYNEKVS